MPKLTKEQVDQILAVDAAERRRRTEEILAEAGQEYTRDVDAQLDHAQATAEFERRIRNRNSARSAKVAAIREAEARRLREQRA